MRPPCTFDRLMDKYKNDKANSENWPKREDEKTKQLVVM